MAEKKFLDANGLKLVKDDYTTKISKKVDSEEGKSLIETEKISKLDGIEPGAQKNNISKVQVNDTDQTIGEDGTLNLDVESVITEKGFITDSALENYVDKSTADTTYAKQEEVNKLAEKSNKVWFMSDDPIKTKADLTALADTATKGECFIISDDENHLYVFLGKETAGCDVNGFYDTHTHVDLSQYATTESLNDYLQSSVAESTYAKQTEVTESLANKADKTDLDALAKTTDLPEALTNEDIEAVLNGGE